MIDYIHLTDDARLGIEQDVDAENPRADWVMRTGFVKIKGRGDSRLTDVLAVHDDPIRIADAHDLLADRTYGYRNRYGLEENVERWARIFHGMVVVYDSEHGGYWFVADLVDEPRGTLDEQRKTIAAERETYRQWAEGEVYGVILERRHSYAKVPVKREPTGGYVELGGDSEILDMWEVEDSLWGNYLDDKYTAQQVAMEHFSLFDDEFEACGGTIERREPIPGVQIHSVSGEF